MGVGGTLWVVGVGMTGMAKRKIDRVTMPLFFMYLVSGSPK